MKILTTPAGKVVRVDVETDEQMYSSPCNPPDTGMRYTRGTDILAHRALSGTWYYYLYTWSMHQGEDETYELISPARARVLLIEAAGMTGYAAMNGAEIARAERHFPGIFEEGV